MRILIMAAAAALATACATQAPPTNHAIEGGRYGYAEMQLQPNRVRVSYNGDTLTPRETVETYLLYRAAETTLAARLRLFHRRRARRRRGSPVSRAWPARARCSPARPSAKSRVTPRWPTS